VNKLIDFVNDNLTKDNYKKEEVQNLSVALCGLVGELLVDECSEDEIIIGLLTEIQSNDKVRKAFYEVLVKNRELLIKNTKSNLDILYIFGELTDYLISEENIQFLQELMGAKASYDKFLEKIKNETKEIGEFHNNMSLKIEKQEDKISQVLPNAISTIGVFVAVLFVFFGGMNLITAFESMAEYSIYRLLMSIMITGQIILNSLFFLMFLISRLARIRVSSICNKFSCREIEGYTFKVPDHIHCYYCQHEGRNEFSLENVIDGKPRNVCSLMEKAFRKYPYIYGTNLMIIAFEIVIVLAYIHQKVLESEYTSYPLFYVVLCAVMVLTVAFTVMYAFYTRNKKTYFKESEINKSNNISVPLLPLELKVYPNPEDKTKSKTERYFFVDYKKKVHTYCMVAMIILFIAFVVLVLITNR